MQLYCLFVHEILKESIFPVWLFAEKRFVLAIGFSRGLAERKMNGFERGKETGFAEKTRNFCHPLLEPN